MWNMSLNVLKCNVCNVMYKPQYVNIKACKLI